MSGPHTNVEWDESDSALSRFFHERVQRSLVFIEHRCLKTNTIVSGTGSVIAFQGNSIDGWLPLILTAGHVIRNQSNAESEFRLSRYSWADPSNPSTRCAVFQTGGTDPRSPCRNFYKGPGHDVIDIGFILGPLNCEDGKPFFEFDENAVAVPNQILPIVQDSNYTAEGTPVAWAGYPGVASDIAKRPQPCYFQGYVSALILQPNSQLYLLDGHNTFGVSGGPVWAYCPEAKEPRVIGAVSSYRYVGANPEIPGFVHAVPIQVLTGYLAKHWGASFH